MRKIVFIAPLLLLLSFVAFAQNEPFAYSATVAKFKKFYNASQPDSIYKLFGPEMKQALSEPDFKNTTAQLLAQLGKLNVTTFTSYTAPAAVYKADFEKGTLNLSLALNDSKQIIGLLLRPYTAPAAPAAATSPSAEATDPSMTEEPYTLKTLSGSLSGTLALPKGASGKVPVVIIIPGSGPTDRDGNNTMGLNTNVYKLTAIALAKNGIASLRYDKRMIGKSTSSTKESELRIDDYVEDALALVNKLKDDDRFSKFFILGHSEGSLIGMLVTNDVTINGFISVGGAGDPAEKILTEQMKARPQYQQDAFKTMLDTLRKGKVYQQADPSIYDIARPSIQPYLMSWCRYNPQMVIKKLKMPVLIIQGSTDVQIKVEQAEKLKKADSYAILNIVQGMNHIMKEAPADREANLATYKDPNLPLKPEFVTTVVSFINKVSKGELVGR